MGTGGTDPSSDENELGASPRTVFSNFIIARLHFHIYCVVFPSGLKGFLMIVDDCAMMFNHVDITLRSFTFFVGLKLLQ